MSPSALIVLASLSLAQPAWAASESTCWLDRDVLVVPAIVAGVSGDFILDTGAMQTVLAETQAQGAGYADTALTSSVVLAGASFPGRLIQVADLDARTHSFPTPIAGVIGADILADYVLELQPSPCRVILRRLDKDVRSRAAGAPLVEASISDGVTSRSGLFVVATGADAAVRLTDDAADIPGARQTAPWRPFGRRRAMLRAFSLANHLSENVAGGLVPPAELPPGTMGVIGLGALAGRSLRLDFPNHRMTVSPG